MCDYFLLIMLLFVWRYVRENRRLRQALSDQVYSVRTMADQVDRMSNPYV